MNNEYIIEILEHIKEETKKKNYKYALVLIKTAVELIKHEMTTEE